MIIEAPRNIVALQLSGELLAKLQPFLLDLGIDRQVQSQQAELELKDCSHQLRMSREAYEMLSERVGDALDYDVRWQPNEYEPDGFVERVRPLDLSAPFVQMERS